MDKKYFTRESLILNKQQCLDHLICSVCMDVIQDAVMETTNYHIFCKECVKNQAQCPICRVQVVYVRNLLANQILEDFKVRCPFSECDWIGQYDCLNQHLMNCQININYHLQTLNYHCDEMKRIIDIEINPHLIQEHLQIYQDHCQDWKFLKEDDREWKWWWWAYNKWWEEPCARCNVLWHKYEKEIDENEAQRLIMHQYLKK